MTAKNKTASQPEFEDEARYEVTLTKRTDLSHLFRDRILPKGSKVTVKGKVLKGILDNVTDIQPLAG